MAVSDGSEFHYTLYDKVTRNFLQSEAIQHFVSNKPAGLMEFDRAYDLRRQISAYHKQNFIESDIVIIKICKTWAEMEGI